MAQRTGSDTTWTYNGQVFNVMTGGPFSRTKTIEDVSYMGVVDQAQASAALRKVNDVPIEVLYDDAATVDGVFQAAYLADVAYPLAIGWGGSKTSTVQAFVKTYERMPKVGAKTRERVTLTCTGAVTEV
jgi:hypothetical protein